MTDTIQSLVHFDQELFLRLNEMHAPWADTLMYWITNKFTWIPLYIVLIAVTIKTEGKKSIAIFATVLAAVLLADQVTSGIMKPYFARFRPCHEPLLAGLVHEVAGCGGQYGFASSHASTSFSLAIAWYVLLKDRVKWIWVLLLWPFIYSYSRIYVGVHYPGDIFVGALVGILSAWICLKLYHNFLIKYYRN